MLDVITNDERVSAIEEELKRALRREELDSRSCNEAETFSSDGNVELNYVHLTSDNLGQDEKYSACLLFDKGSRDVRRIQDVIGIVKEKGARKYGSFNPTQGGLRDGDQERSSNSLFKGKIFNSRRKSLYNLRN